MKNSVRHTIVIAALLLLFLGVTPADAGILTQCPGNIIGDGPETDMAGVKCLHLSSGDGFTRMADGKDQYIFLSLIHI